MENQEDGERECGLATSSFLIALGNVLNVRTHTLLVKYSTGQSWISEAPCAETALVAPVEKAKPHSWSTTIKK